MATKEATKKQDLSGVLEKLTKEQLLSTARGCDVEVKASATKGAIIEALLSAAKQGKEQQILDYAGEY